LVFFPATLYSDNTMFDYAVSIVNAWLLHTAKQTKQRQVTPYSVLQVRRWGVS